MLLVIHNQSADSHPRRVFLSYSHTDMEWKDRVVEALRPLEREQRIASWHDRKLLPGQDWDGEIRQELNQADVILFLVSPTFIRSRYCRDVEVRRAVERSDAGEAVLVPIIVHRCDFQKEPFARFQAYPVDGSPLDEAPDQETRLADLREKLHLALLGWWYPRRPRGEGRTHAVWQLQFRPQSDAPLPSDEHLVRRLREIADEPDIVSLGRGQEQSVEQRLQSIAPIVLLNGPPGAFAKLEELQQTGGLSSQLGVEVISLQLVLGATIQAATELSDSASPLLEVNEHLVLTASPHETPDLPQMLIVRDEQPGWTLVLPGRGGAATPRAMFPEAQARFARYLGTILAVPDGRLTVNLSTYEPEATLRESLARTELGHDLMEQDCLLKQYAASLLHPDHPVGRAYWDGMLARARKIAGSDQIPLRAYQKAWVVPGHASVHEKSPDKPFGFAFPESFGVRETDRACTVTSCTLDVLCEADYLAVNHHCAPDGTPGQGRLLAEMSDASATLFRELLLPAIKAEVNEGTHFTKLRQIYHAFVLGTWFRRALKELPAYAKAFEVVDRGVPEAFGVQRSDEWTAKNKAVYQRYLALFHQGVFRCARSVESENLGEAAVRIYFSGAVAFDTAWSQPASHTTSIPKHG
jgi:hypothetical protein